ncbi:MAG: hypothetical protein ACYSR8_11540 [Planctomycetota bacterium]|jgi:hypothetical protein
MKRVLLNPVMILAAIWLTGCTVVVHEHKSHPPHEPDVIHVPADGVIEEINAAGKLSFDPHRRDAYMRIAKRPDLSDAAQVHLVNAAFDNLSFEPMKRDVLMALISNPCFSPAGRQAILTQLDKLSFEPTKTEILEAISRR